MRRPEEATRSIRVCVSLDTFSSSFFSSAIIALTLAMASSSRPPDAPLAPPTAGMGLSSSRGGLSYDRSSVGARSTITASRELVHVSSHVTNRSGGHQHWQHAAAAEGCSTSKREGAQLIKWQTAKDSRLGPRGLARREPMSKRPR